MVYSACFTCEKDKLFVVGQFEEGDDGQSGVG